MNQVQNKIKHKNQGFSLIEVIVSILILAIIVVPILHNFTIAARSNQKARQQQYASSLAQNTLELVESVGVDGAVKKLSGASPTPDPVFVSPAPADGEDYYYEVTTQEGTMSFKVKIEYDSSAYYEVTSLTPNNLYQKAEIDALYDDSSVVLYPEESFMTYDEFGHAVLNNTADTLAINRLYEIYTDAVNTAYAEWVYQDWYDYTGGDASILAMPVLQMLTEDVVSDCLKKEMRVTVNEVADTEEDKAVVSYELSYQVTGDFETLLLSTINNLGIALAGITDDGNLIFSSFDVNGMFNSVILAMKSEADMEIDIATGKYGLVMRDMAADVLLEDLNNLYLVYRPYEGYGSGHIVDLYGENKIIIDTNWTTGIVSNRDVNLFIILQTESTVESSDLLIVQDASDQTILSDMMQYEVYSQHQVNIYPGSANSELFVNHTLSSSDLYTLEDPSERVYDAVVSIYNETGETLLASLSTTLKK